MIPNCREVGERLLRFRDGELPPDEERWLREHLHLCPNCVTLLDSYEAALGVLARLRPVQMPPGILDRIRRRLEDGTPPSC